MSGPPNFHAVAARASLDAADEKIGSPALALTGIRKRLPG
jgi:hypothetical protein